MPNRMYWCTSLTGGDAGALNALDGSDLFNKDAAIAIDAVEGILHPYILDEDSGLAESSPDVIMPLTNAGDKRWIRLSLETLNYLLSKIDNETIQIDGDKMFVSIDEATIQINPSLKLFVRQASSSVTGIAKFSSSDFVVDGNGLVSLIPIYLSDCSYLVKTQADSPYNVLEADLHGLTIHCNSGATGETIFLLGEGAEGRDFKAEVIESQYVQIKAATGERIRYGASVTADGGYIRCNISGGNVSMRWNDIENEWVIYQIVEYWRADS